MPEVTEIGRKYSSIAYENGARAIADLEAGVGVRTIDEDGNEVRSNSKAKQDIRSLR